MDEIIEDKIFQYYFNKNFGNKKYKSFKSFSDKEKVDFLINLYLHIIKIDFKENNYKKKEEKKNLNLNNKRLMTEFNNIMNSYKKCNIDNNNKNNSNLIESKSFTIINNKGINITNKNYSTFSPLIKSAIIKGDNNNTTNNNIIDSEHKYVNKLISPPFLEGDLVDRLFRCPEDKRLELSGAEASEVAGVITRLVRDEEISKRKLGEVNKKVELSLQKLEEIFSIQGKSFADEKKEDN